jgi:hypothetical protein
MILDVHLRAEAVELDLVLPVFPAGGVRAKVGSMGGIKGTRYSISWNYKASCAGVPV